MTPQFLLDGVLNGSVIALGAIGVTLTYSILRFSNFAHGDFLAWGAYFTLLTAGGIGAVVGAVDPIGAFSFGWPLLAATAIAMALTGGLAIGLDAALFRRLRDRGQTMVVVIASFGASMAMRSLLEFLFTSRPTYFNRELQIATPIGGGLRITPDQIALLGLTVVAMALVQVFMTRSQTGRAMRAVSQNVALARVAGVNVERVVRTTWMLGGALACAAGVMIGVLVQIRPLMGLDLLLPLFAAAILGGIGSVPGAMLGGLVIGLAEAGAVQFVGAEWRAGVAFLALTLILLVRPNGLFGQAER